MKMRVASSLLLAVGLVGVSAAQMPETAPTSGSAPAAPAPAAPAMGAIQSEFAGALGPVRLALGDVRLDRWKLSKALRDQTEGDIGSIKRDMDGTLPGLVSTADASPGAVTAMLPVASNVNALYDVLLRVTERAKVAAPANQVDELVQAQTSLDGARRSLTESLQKAAAAEEQQVVALKQAARPAVATACPPPAAASTAPSRTAAKKKKKPVTPTQN